MSDYQVPEGYKQAEVRVVPEDWKSLRLGDVITLQRGFDLPARLRKIGNIPIISSSGITDVHSESPVSGPGVVTGRYGTIGEVFFIDRDFWPLNTTLFVSDFKENEPLFIYFFLRTIDYKTYSGKSGVPGVNRNDLHEISVRLPPIKEQRAIAQTLSDIDSLISKQDKLIVKKRYLKTATMQQLLTGKNRLPGFSEGKGYQKTEIGVIPKDWKIDRVKSLAAITTGGRNTQDRTNDGRYPFFVRSQTTERINSYSFDGEAVLTAGDGVGTGKVFHYIKGKFDIHQRVYKISNFNSNLDGFFFYTYFSNCFYNRIMSMTAKSSVDSVRMEMIANMLVPLPSSSEQRAIAQVLSDMNTEIAALETRRDKTKAIKQGMMQELLTGRTRLV